MQLEALESTKEAKHKSAPTARIVLSSFGFIGAPVDIMVANAEVYWPSLGSRRAPNRDSKVSYAPNARGICTGGQEVMNVHKVER